MWNNEGMQNSGEFQTWGTCLCSEAHLDRSHQVLTKTNKQKMVTRLEAEKGHSGGSTKERNTSSQRKRR